MNCPSVSFAHGSSGTIIASLKTPFSKNTYIYNVISYSGGNSWNELFINYTIIEKIYPECYYVYY